MYPFRSIIRFGSTKSPLEKYNKITPIKVEINKIEAIKNSSNKLLMKQCFDKNDVKTAIWANANNIDDIIIKLSSYNEEEVLPLPIVSKHIYGSRGRGNEKHDSLDDLIEWTRGKTLSNYIFEKYYNYTKEYRLHVTKNGCFYACRKMLKEDTPDDKRWFRNNLNSIWVTQYIINRDNEGNFISFGDKKPEFDEPVNWNDIVETCVNALNAVGLDFGAIDLRVQGSKNSKGNLRENPEYIVVEINSAPSFGDITEKLYIVELDKLINDKFNNREGRS